MTVDMKVSLPMDLTGSCDGRRARNYLTQDMEGHMTVDIIGHSKVDRRWLHYSTLLDMKGSYD